MSYSSIDYFATLGRKEGELSCKNILPIGADTDEHNVGVHPSEVWKDAITDIEIVYKDMGENVRDSTWELVDVTVGGTPADFLEGVSTLGSVYLAIRRRRSSSRLDHISDITIVYMGESVPDDFEVIEKSLSGESFFENGSCIPRTRLAIRRASASDSAIVNGIPFIDDIGVINVTQNEVEPEGFQVVDRYVQQPKSWKGDNMKIAYHKREPLGLCDLKYESSTLDRFPLEDKVGLPLPVNELPMFVFPHGLLLKHDKKQSFPLPDFFTFVFTDIHGRHMYTACLRFYEVVPQREIEKFVKLTYDYDNDVIRMDEMNIFTPKVICVVSQYPFYRAMGRFLKQLYSLSLSPSFSPLEHFISSVVSQIPVPVQGGRPFYVVLDAALISQSSRSMQPIKFELPPKCFFPPMDLDFSGPMRCLSLDHMLMIFCLLLQESKVIFLCSSNALLTDVMETFRALLFPLRWSSCFVTRLPDLLSGLLQAPGGFMIGIHMLLYKDTDKQHDKSGADDIFSRYGADEVWAQSLQGGTFIVDLSEDNIYYFDGKNAEVMSAAKILSILRVMPTGPLNKLQSKLSNIAKKFCLCPQDIVHAQFDSVFEFHSFDADMLPAGVHWSDFPTMEVRDCFLRFMVDLLSDYSRYVIAIPNSSPSTFRTFREMFKVETYVQHADKSAKQILEALIETQMFANLIQERLESPSYHLLYFDKAVRRLKDLNLSSLVSDHRYSRKYWQRNHNTVEYKAHSSSPLYENISMMDSRDASFMISSEISSFEDPTPMVLKRKRDLVMGSVTHFEYALGRDDRSDSHDMTIGKSTDRGEVVECDDLRLGDFTKGALIIPGPLLEERNIDRDGDTPTDQEYIYDKCWPNFNHALTDEVTNDAVRKVLKRLRQCKEQLMEGAESCCEFFIREESERNCYRLNRRLLNAFHLPLFYDSKDAATLSSFPDECKAAISLTTGFFNVSIVLLSVLSMRSIWSSRIVLQVLGILSHLDSLNVLNQVDESAWRSLLIASNRMENEYFKENVMKILQVAMKSAGVLPNILTSNCLSGTASFFQRKEFPSNSATENETDNFPIDSFCYLEEMGMAWFSQKVIPLVDGNLFKSDEGKSNTPMFHYDLGPRRFRTNASSTVSSPMRRFSNIFKKNASDSVVSHLARRKSVRSALVVTEYTNAMRLVRDNSCLVLPRPQRAKKWLSLRTILPAESVNSGKCDRVKPGSKLQNIEETVEEIRNAFCKIQKVMDNAPLDHIAAYAGNTSGAYKLTISLMKAKILSACTCEDGHIVLTTIYARVWTSLARMTPMKTSPGIQACCMCSPDDSVEEDKCSALHSNFDLDVDTVKFTEEEIYVELCGDFKKHGASSCHLFDQSIGVGQFKTKYSEERNKKNNVHVVHMHSPAGDMTAEVTVTVRICERDSSISTSSTGHLPVRSSSLGTGIPSGGHRAKKSWRERLSFGLYKDESGEKRDDLEGKNIVNSISESCSPCSLQNVDNETGERNDIDPGTDVFPPESGLDESDFEGKSTSLATSGLDNGFSEGSADNRGDSNSSELEKLRADLVKITQETKQTIIDIEELTHTVIQQRGRVVGMHSASPCQKCGYYLLDDEVMAVWAGFGPCQEHKELTSAEKYEKDIVKAHSLSCWNCGETLTPMLHVKEYKVNETQRNILSLDSEWKSTVPYLSPYGVRNCIESLIAESGTEILSSPLLLVKYPTIYWNILWYSIRFILPSGINTSDSLEGFLADENSGHCFRGLPITTLAGPIVIGWRECVVEARIKRIFANEDDDILLKDLFPGADEDEVSAAENLISTFESGAHDFSRIVIQCAQFKSLHACFSQSTARGLYLTLLVIVNWKSPHMVCCLGNNLYNDLSKGSSFDCLYMDALRKSLSPTDYVSIEVESVELCGSASSKCAQCIRMLIGFLF